MLKMPHKGEDKNVSREGLIKYQTENLVICEEKYPYHVYINVKFLEKVC